MFASASDHSDEPQLYSLASAPPFDQLGDSQEYVTPSVPSFIDYSLVYASASAPPFDQLDQQHASTARLSFLTFIYQSLAVILQSYLRVVLELTYATISSKVNQIHRYFYPFPVAVPIQKGIVVPDVTYSSASILQAEDPIIESSEILLRSFSFPKDLRKMKKQVLNIGLDSINGMVIEIDDRLISARISDLIDFLKLPILQQRLRAVNDNGTASFTLRLVYSTDEILTPLWSHLELVGDLLHISIFPDKLVHFLKNEEEILSTLQENPPNWKDGRTRKFIISKAKNTVKIGTTIEISYTSFKIYGKCPSNLSFLSPKYPLLNLILLLRPLLIFVISQISSFFVQV
jgi:hypothetical protein